MSAQDDVLAAFGELPERRGKDADAEFTAADELAESSAAVEEQAADSETEAVGEEVEAVGEQAEAAEGSGERAAATQDAESPAIPETSAGGEASASGEQIAAAEGVVASAVGIAAGQITEPQTLAESPAAPDNQQPSLSSGQPGQATPSAEPQTIAGSPPAPDNRLPAQQAPSAGLLSQAQPHAYLDPAAFFAQLQAESGPKAKRRWPRLLVRYASALVVAGAVGVGTAYAVSLPRRTDVPFLATPSDGRYDFPAMARPAPPVGKPAPGDDSNEAQVHYGDLRQYLVSAPVGVAPTDDGWEPVADFEAAFGPHVADQLYDAGLRRVARRAWSMPDGQHTVVELLQFPDHEAAYTVADSLGSSTPVKASQQENVVPKVTLPAFGDDTVDVAMRKFDQVSGSPGLMERQVVFGLGDVVAIVTSTAPARVPDTATQQVALLEAEMLR